MDRASFRVMWTLCAVATAGHAGAASAATIERHRGNGLELVVVHGELAHGDEKRFIEAALPVDNGVVVFDSPGGNLQAGLEIGRAIRLKGLPTYVPDKAVCASACALAWLGGSRRYVSPDSSLGFHAAYRTGPDGAPVPVATGNAMVGAYLNSLGFGTPAIVFVTSAPPEGMAWLPPARAREIGIDVDVLRLDARPQPPAGPIATNKVEASRGPDGHGTATGLEHRREWAPAAPARESLPTIVVRPEPSVDWTQQGEWVQAASRPKLDEAVAVAEGVRARNVNVGVFRYANGWFGVVVGPFSPGRGEVARSALVAAGEVPADSLVTRGSRFASLEWGRLVPRVGAPVAPEVAAASFAERFFSSWSSDDATALRFLADAYPDTLLYFDKPSDKGFVLADKQRFTERWFRRRYVQRRDATEARCDAASRLCVVTSVVDWDVLRRDRDVRSTGTARYDLGILIGAEPGDARIVSERSEVLSRELSSSARP